MSKDRSAQFTLLAAVAAFGVSIWRARIDTKRQQDRTVNQ
jgi:hypothetical protein